MKDIEKVSGSSLQMVFSPILPHCISFVLRSSTLKLINKYQLACFILEFMSHCHALDVFSNILLGVASAACFVSLLIRHAQILLKYFSDREWWQWRFYPSFVQVIFNISYSCGSRLILADKLFDRIYVGAGDLIYHDSDGEK